MALTGGISRKRTGSGETGGEPTSSKKLRPNFCVTTFVEKLRKDECNAALEEFIRLCHKINNEHNPALKFLREGGQMMNIINVLDGGHCQNPHEVSSVFATLRLLLLRVLTQVPEQRRRAEEVCDRLLNNYLNHIHSHLCVKSDARMKKVVLQLLTAVVTVNVGLAKNVLSHVSLSIDVVDNLVEMAKPVDKQSVRTCFIHFLMAFLVEGNASVIGLLLDQRNILTSIVPGLVYDSSDLVVFVLTTLRSKLVEVIAIPKTKKIYTFNTRVMCGLLNLYKWKGPGAHVGKWNKKPRETDLDIVVSKEQLDSVGNAVHSLLLSLCTSFHCGVVFRDPYLGMGDTRQNILVASVIKELENPWDHKLQSELVKKIVQLCPELACIPFTKVAPVLSPRASSSWIKAINFATEIMSSLVLNNLANIKPNLAHQAAKTLVCPFNLLIPICSTGMIHAHPTVRLKSAKFFQAVLKAAKWVRKVFGEQELAKFDRCIVKLLPNGVILDNAWQLSLNKKVHGAELSAKSIPTPPIEQMMALVDIMSTYQCHYPLLLDFEGKFVSLSSTLLKSLDLDHSSDPRILNMKLKVFKILTQMDTSILDPGKSGFSSAIGTLLSLSTGDGVIAIEVQSALGAILVKCGVFDTASADAGDELDVWVHCYRSAEHTHLPQILSFLQKALSTVAVNPTLYVEQMLDRQQEIFSPTQLEKHNAAVSRADQVFEELLSTIEDEKMLHKVNLHNEISVECLHKEKYDYEYANMYGISSLLMCVLEIIAGEENLEMPVQIYLSRVLLHLLHMQVDPKLFISVTKRWNSMPVAVAKYINSWLEEQPLPMTDPYGHFSSECLLSHFFLVPNKDIPELDENDNPIAILSLARLVCFHIVQLAERQKLTESHAVGGSAVVLSLLEALQKIYCNQDESEPKKYIIKFFNTFFKHPILVSYFSPLHKKKHINAKLITNFLMNILKEAGKYEDLFERRIITSLLRENLLKNIFYNLEKSSKVPPRSETLLLALQFITLTEDEKCTLISILKNHMLMKPWTELLVYLLNDVDMLPPCEIKSFGSVLGNCLQRGDKDGDKSAAWIVCEALNKCIDKFPYCVSHLPNDLFEKVFCKEGMKLASSMLHHESPCMKIFTTLIEQENSSVFLHGDALLHLMNVYTQHESLPPSTLKTVFNYYKPNILKAMSVPLSHPGVLADYPSIVQLLIKECMEPELCEELCNTLVKNYKNLGLWLPFHLSVIRGLQELGEWRKKPTDLVKILLPEITQRLQKGVPDDLVNQLCCTLVQHMAGKNNNWNEVLEPDESWTEIPGLFLRIALKKSDAEKQSLACNILRVLTYTLWRAKAHKMAGVVFEMTTSHSQFLDIVLAQEKTDVKLAVLQLVLVCYQLVPPVMKSVHIPIWLGAYGASLSYCDQVILKILHCFHKNKDVDLGAFRPFLWGEAAVNHYSIRSRAAMSLWRVPQATVVLGLLQAEIVDATISDFPINRKLLIENDDADIELAINNWSTESLETSQPELYDPAFMLPLFNHLMAPESVVYDYKFSRLGGLALTLASLGSKCRYMRAAALSVISRFHNRLDMRSSFSRIHEQYLEVIKGGIRELRDFKNQKTKNVGEKSINKQTEANELGSHDNGNEATELGSHDNGKGATELGSHDNVKEATELGSHDHGKEATELGSHDYGIEATENISNERIEWAPKLPNLSAAFLARTSLILLNPLETVHGALTKFILAKPSLKLYTVPEFLELMRPSSVEYRSYQEWLLETVLIGMKTPEDVAIARSCRFFKLMFSLFSSSISDSRIKTLIVQVLEAAVKVNSGIPILMKCGLIPWLYSLFPHIYNANDGALTLSFLRVLVLLENHFPIPVQKTLPLLFNLPLFVQHDNLLIVLQIVQFSIAHVSREHLVVVLRLCFLVLDEKLVKTIMKQLQISISDLTSEVNMYEIKESLKYAYSRETVDKSELKDKLNSIVHCWLSCNLQSEKEKKQKNITGQRV